ncbi:hypothetical protein A0J61_11349, partial [Choanephora cucurbitarum]
VIESALAVSTRTREFSASPALDQGDRSSRPVIDRHEGSTEPIVEQEDIPDFEGISPVASVISDDPMEIEEVDEVVNNDVEEEPAVTETTEEEDLSKCDLQWLDDAQVDTCDDLAMKLMHVFIMNKISRQGQRNIFKCLDLDFMLKIGSESVLTGKHFKTPDTYRRCCLYPVGDASKVTCPNENCGVARYKNTAAVNVENRDPTMPPPALVAQQQMAYTSISQALTQLYVDDDRSEMLSYRDHFLIILR